MDDMYEILRYKMTYKEFSRLPGFSSYKSEYVDGHAVLLPRVKGVQMAYHLNVRPCEEVLPRYIEPKIRGLEQGDWVNLMLPMKFAFCHTQPFKSMENTRLEECVAECLRRTKDGVYGELVEDLCKVAVHENQVIGASVITLQGESPHLTWIFVNRRFQGFGVGAALLQQVVVGASKRWSVLLSTARSDNTGALIWHWRMGFEIRDILGRV
jgi:GNAT superfamily N-acetyltransferase